MSSSEPLGSHRKHVTSACLTCRQRKIKCDGLQPVCSPCQLKDKHCAYQTGNDRRRLSHRLAMDILVDRIQDLTKFIRDNSLVPPPMEKQTHASLIKSLGQVRLSKLISGKDGFVPGDHQSTFPDFLPTPDGSWCDDAFASSSSPADTKTSIDLRNCTETPVGCSDRQKKGPCDRSINERVAEVLPCLPGQYVPSFSFDLESSRKCNDDAEGLPEWEWTLSCEPPPINNRTDEETQMKLTSQEQCSAPPSSGCRTEKPSADAPSTVDSTNKLNDEFSDHVENLKVGPGGQLRYDGPNSNFKSLDLGIASGTLKAHRSVRIHGPDQLNRLGIGKKVPSEFEDHLANLYFTWQDPALHVVKRGIYERAKHTSRHLQQDTPYFSESLQNALCCLGATFEARYRPSFATFPRTLADFFADRAKALLEIELDSPSIATIQALIMLSSHETGSSHATRGGLYISMATRLASLLGLHLDVTSQVITKSLTQEEADLRRDVFWAAYSVNHMWSFGLGHTFQFNMEAVTVQAPEGNDAGKRRPYVYSRPSINLEALPSHAAELHAQRVALCRIMVPMGSVLHGDLAAISDALHEVSMLTSSKLHTWKANLPPHFQVDEDDYDTEYLPQVLLLHMLFYQQQIHTCRLRMSRQHRRQGHDQDPAPARATCIEAAVSIAKLIHIYETHHGLRRINIQAIGAISSAAMLLLLAVTVKQPQPGSFGAHLTPALHLGSCFRALEELSMSWESARQACDSLRRLQHHLEAQNCVAWRAQNWHSTTPVCNVYRRNVSPDEKASPIVDMDLDQRVQGPWAEETETDARNIDMTVDLDWIFMGGNRLSGNSGDNRTLDSPI